MKYLLILLFISVSFLIKAQNFAPLNAKWQFSNWHMTTEVPYSDAVVSKDTLIDDRYCTIINLFYNGAQNILTRVIIHEDEGKIFFYEDDEFKLFFDFNLSIGDTLVYRVPANAAYFQTIGGGGSLPNKYYFARIEDISTLTVDGVELLRFQTSWIIPEDDDDFETYWGLGTFTQRLGCLQGLFGRSGIEVLGGTPGFFSCYEDDEINSNWNGNPCDFSLNTNEIKINEVIQIYPNPTKDFIKIDLSTENCDYVKIFNLQGKVMRSVSTEMQSVIEIDLTGIPSGIYFVEMNCKRNLNKYGRIIKMV